MRSKRSYVKSVGRRRITNKMVTRIKDLVRNDGEITTIEELDKKGLIEYHEARNFLSRGKVMTKYFADIKGTRDGWEIGKLAFLSRTNLAFIRTISAIDRNKAGI
jgi:hypothetical protein